MLISLPGSEVAHHPTVPPGPHCPRVEPAALPYLSLEGSSCITRDKSFVNLPCNTINTVPQVLAMDWTPECNRVEEKSLEERIMSSEWI